MRHQELNGKSDINFSDKFILESRIQQPSTSISFKVHVLVSMVLKWAEISLKTFAGTVRDATAKQSPYYNEMHFHIFDLGSFKAFSSS